jgi:pre-mRNA-splicing helicase BRR2
MQDIEGLTYRPRTAETQQVYELMLSVVHACLGDQAQDIVRSAADTILETLKNDSAKDFDKKRDIEDVLGPLLNTQFSQLVSLSKKITDYGAEDEAVVDPDMERKDAEIDNELGVAVVFDEEEQDESDDENYEIRDESDDEDEEQQVDGEPPESGDLGDEELVISGESSGQANGKSKADRDMATPHSIDAFWVQRHTTEDYPNPVTAADKAASVLSILGSKSSLHDCEYQLMELFDFESYHTFTKFLKNCDIIVWCTKLMRSDAEECINVEVAMQEKGLGWMLKDLAGDRRTAVRSDAMDVVEKTAHPAAAPKTGTVLLFSPRRLSIWKA